MSGHGLDVGRQLTFVSLSTGTALGPTLGFGPITGANSILDPDTADDYRTAAVDVIRYGALLDATDGVEIDQKMLALSTYMGHAEIGYTYWYLTGIPALMKVVAARFEQQAQRNSMGESS